MVSITCKFLDWHRTCLFGPVMSRSIIVTLAFAMVWLPFGTGMAAQTASPNAMVSHSTDSVTLPPGLAPLLERFAEENLWLVDHPVWQISKVEDLGLRSETLRHSALLTTDSKQATVMRSRIWRLTGSMQFTKSNIEVPFVALAALDVPPEPGYVLTRLEEKEGSIPKVPQERVAFYSGASVPGQVRIEVSEGTLPAPRQYYVGTNPLIRQVWPWSLPLIGMKSEQDWNNSLPELAKKLVGLFEKRCELHRFPIMTTYSRPKPVAADFESLSSGREEYVLLDGRTFLKEENRLPVILHGRERLVISRYGVPEDKYISVAEVHFSLISARALERFGISFSDSAKLGQMHSCSEFMKEHVDLDDRRFLPVNSSP